MLSQEQEKINKYRDTKISSNVTYFKTQISS